MGERCLRKAEVGGSNPLPSTKRIRHLATLDSCHNFKLSEFCPKTHFSPTIEAFTSGVTIGVLGNDST